MFPIYSRIDIDVVLEFFSVVFLFSISLSPKAKCSDYLINPYNIVTGVNLCSSFPKTNLNSGKHTNDGYSMRVHDTVVKGKIESKIMLVDFAINISIYIALKLGSALRLSACLCTNVS